MERRRLPAPDLCSRWVEMKPCGSLLIGWRYSLLFVCAVTGVPSDREKRYSGVSAWPCRKAAGTQNTQKNDKSAAAGARAATPGYIDVCFRNNRQENQNETSSINSMSGPLLPTSR